MGTLKKVEISKNGNGVNGNGVNGNGVNGNMTK
jgi:hypothetical protein